LDEIGSKGQPTVNNLLISAGVVTGKKVSVHNVKKVEAAAAAPKAEEKRLIR